MNLNKEKKPQKERRLKKEKKFLKEKKRLEVRLKKLKLITKAQLKN